MSIQRLRGAPSRRAAGGAEASATAEGTADVPAVRGLGGRKSHRRNAGLLRVLRLLRRLEGARYVQSLESLANEYGVTTRTIRRDLVLLEEAGYRLPRWRFNYDKGDVCRNLS